MEIYARIETRRRSLFLVSSCQIDEFRFKAMF